MNKHILELTAKDAAELYQLFENNSIKVWVDGGWAVDALVGKQTRKHNDLDIAMYHKDVPKLRALLEARGYKDVWRDDTRPCNFVLGDDKGHQLDVHTFELDEHGNNIFGVAYVAAHFGGEGVIGGHTVRCINPKTLVQFHTGYAVDEDDHHDVLVLCEKFGIELPEQHKHWEARQEVVRAIRSLSLRDNRPRVIAVSGFGGSGKSTLATWLKQQLGSTEIVPADDFILNRARERGADWSSYDRSRLQSQVLEPAWRGKPIRYQVYDWRQDRLGTWRTVPKRAYLIVEGLGLLHPDLRPYYDFSIWVDCPLEVATQRGIERDRRAGNDHDQLWLKVWMPNERDFMEKYRPDLAADTTFNTN